MTQSPDSSPSPIDLEVALLLCTRLCHDLAGPVGAVNTGAELLEEEAAGVDADTLDLLAGSARSAANRLKALRMATGVVRGRSPGLGEAVSTARLTLEGMGKTLVDDLGAVEDPGARANQILINLVMVVAEAWPRSTTITVEAAHGAFLISAADGGELGEDWRLALEGRAEALDPRTVQAFLAGRLAAAIGALVDPPPGRPGTLRLAVPPVGGA